jgi:WD40 repeat protein
VDPNENSGLYYPARILSATEVSMARSRHTRVFPHVFPVLVAVAAWLPLGAVESGGEGKDVQVVATLKGHAEEVYSVAFSPDGKFVATGSFDHTLKLWESATGKEVKTLAGQAGHQKQVLCVAFSPDGRSLASGGSDNSLKIWDVPDGSPLKVLFSEAALDALALSPDGTKLAGAGKDGVIKVYKTSDYQQLFTVKGNETGVRGLAFSPNNQTLAASGAEGTVRFWNAQNGQFLVTLGAHHGPANAVAWHPNSQTVYSIGDDGFLKFWQVPNAQQLPRVLPSHGGAVTALALSQDLNQVLSGSADKSVRLTNFANGQPIRTLAGADASITAIAGNNAIVAAGSADGRLLVWAADGKLLGRFRADIKAVTAVSVQPQNTHLLSGGVDGQIKLWGLPPRPTRILAHPDSVMAAALSPGGARLYTGAANTLRAWDVGKAQLDRQFTGNTVIAVVAVSPSGQVLAAGGADGTVHFWDQQKGMEISHLGAHNGRITSLALPSEEWMLSAAEDGTVKLWHLPPAPPRPFAHPDQITAMAISPDGNHLLTGCTDKQARLWNLKSGQKERDLAGPELAVTAVAFSTDGKTVAAGSADKSLTLWSSGGGKPLKRLSFSSAIRCVAFCQDNRTVAAGLEDATIVLVDVLEGKQAKKLSAHNGTVTALAFNPMGGELISASADRTIIRWDLEKGTAAHSLRHVGPVDCLALDADGTRIAAAAGKSCKVWSLAQNKEIASFDAVAEIRAVDFAPEPDTLVFAGADGNAHVYGLEGKRREFFPHPAQVTAVVTHRRDRSIVTGSADKLARVWHSTQLWQRRHSGAVRQAIFSPKADIALSVGDDKAVRVWNAADGAKKLVFAAHDGAVLAAALSADMSQLVTVGSDKRGKLWDLKALLSDPKQPAPLTTIVLPDLPEQLALSGSGARVAIAMGEGQKGSSIRVYDLPSFREITVLDGHPGGTHSLAFQSENTLVSAGADKVARVTDVGTIAAWKAHQGHVTALHYHPNGNQALSAGTDQIVILWDLGKRTVLRRFDSLGEPVADACFSRDGQWVAATGGKRVQVWNTLDGKQVVSITMPANGLSLALAVDRSRIAVRCDNGETQVYESATGKPLQFYRDGAPGKGVVFHGNDNLVRAEGNSVRVESLTIHRALNGTGRPLRALAVTSNGATVLTAGTDQGVKLWNSANGNLERTLAAEGSDFSSLAISRSNALVAVGGLDKTLRVFTLGDGKLQKSTASPDAIRSLAFSPNDRELAVGYANGALQVVNAVFAPNQPMPEFLRPMQSFSHGGATTGVAVANDNRTLYSTGSDKALKAWKISSDAPSKNYPHPGFVNAVGFQPRGSLLASGGQDGKLRLFDRIKGTQVREINAHPTKDGTMIYAVAWTPDGKQVLTAGYDKSLRLFDAATGNKVREFQAYKAKDFEQGHQESVFCAAISPDGKYVASGSCGLERVIKIWNLADGKVVRDLHNPQLKTKASHPGWVYGVRFTHDGKYLVSVGDAPRNKGFLAIWSVADGKLVLRQELPLGVFFTVDVAPDSSLLVVGAGSRGPSASGAWNSAYLLRVPMLKK